MIYKILISIVFIFSLFGCKQTDDRYALVEEGDVVLVEVDGHPVTLPMLEFLMTARGADSEDTEAMRQMFDELLRLRAVANRADREGIADRAKVRAQRAVRDMELKYRNYLEAWQGEHPVTDDQIESAYQAQRERAGDTRFIIETIEFDRQPAALDELQQLQDGETDFEQAIERATEEGRLARRTDWIDLSQVPSGFGEVLRETAVDEVVDSVLPYQDKWIVVRVFDRDELTPPDLEEVREGIRRTLMGERTRAMIEQTFDEAEITPILPLEQKDDTD